jgi:hypothetical protein
VRVLRVPDERPFLYLLQFSNDGHIAIEEAGEDRLIGRSAMLELFNSCVARRAGKMKGIILRLIPQHLSFVLYHILS